MISVKPAGEIKLASDVKTTTISLILMWPTRYSLICLPTIKISWIFCNFRDEYLRRCLVILLTLLKIFLTSLLCLNIDLIFTSFSRSKFTSFSFFEIISIVKRWATRPTLVILSKMTCLHKSLCAVKPKPQWLHPLRGPKKQAAPNP